MEKKNLLEKVEKGIADIPLYKNMTEYNFFYILKIEAKEVIICRFLADLLNPYGMHGNGIVFLKSFLENILDMSGLSDLLLKNTTVVTEYLIEGDRRIDIVISNSRFFIPIEVKIFADEQENQCYDYYEYAKKHFANVQIVYLTRFATVPKLFSRKDLSLDKIKCIGWERNIIPWLKDNLDSLSNQTAYMIMQFIDSIHSVADSREDGIMEKTKELVSETSASFEAALQIEKVMKRAKLDLIQDVFKEFELQMEPYCEKYGLKKEDKGEYYLYNEKYQEKFYDVYSTYPGLNYIVEKAHMSNRNVQMWFRIEVEHNLYAGFTLFDFAAEPKDVNIIGYQIENITDEMYNDAEKYLDKDIFIKESNWWLTYCYSNGMIEEKNYDDVPNFKEMNQYAISLVDQDNCKKYVHDSLLKFEEVLFKNLK